MAQITVASLHAIIVERMEATYVKVTDTSGGCGQAFQVDIVSPRFQGYDKDTGHEKRMGVKDRHDIVHRELKEEIAALHAWSARCKTPAEYEKNPWND